MGIGDLFKRRRERESALPPRALEELRAEADAASEDDPADEEPPEAEPSRRAELPGADAAELGSMLRRAAMTGLPQVTTERHAVDLDRDELAREVLAILTAQGIDDPGPAQAVDPGDLGELRDQVREALRRQGIDPDSNEPL